MRQLARFILCGAFLISFPLTAFTQTSDWAVVSQLFPGQKVKVETAGGKSHVGKVRSVTPDRIQLDKNQLIQRVDIQHILLWSPGHHGRNALIGLGIGAGVGVAFGASCGGKDAIVGKGACIAAGAPFFGGLGAAIGALLPSHGRWHEVYQSE